MLLVASMVCWCWVSVRLPVLALLAQTATRLPHSFTHFKGRTQ